MTNLAWCTDIHLDCVDEKHIVAFAQALVKDDPTGIIVTGDISTSSQIVYHLSIIEKVVQRPIYFVCGNHDFYDAGVEDTRRTLKELTNISPFIRHMATVPFVSVTPKTAIVGHECWYDAQLGSWQNSGVKMQDWYRIREFLPINENKNEIVNVSRKLAHEGCLHIQEGIKAAARNHKSVIVLTHFPPFAEAHTYQGKVADPHFLPWYTNAMLGSMLMDASRAYPNTTFTVFAGHTHGAARVSPARNLVIHVGEATYGNPQLQALVEVA